ncbi:MAG: sulfite exporter TauE/SafE family protein [Myxococcales bacterium]|nr:sulfite exporter TauE/SafE family protein [Myxococcales bacterium]
MPAGPILYLVLLLSAALGFSLGAFGGGGTLLAVPMLMYVAGMDAKNAIGTSLLIVGLTSLVAAGMYWRAGRVELRAVLMLGLSGALGAVLGAQVTSWVSDFVLTVLFATLMLLVSLRMLFSRDSKRTEKHAQARRRPMVLLSVGTAIGFLTGFLGVGGGFLLVPALAILVNLPMKQAVGTSLAIVTLNSTLGFFGHMAELSVNLWSAASLALPAAVGALVGQRLAHRWSEQRIRTGFAVLSMLVAIGMLAKELS